MKNYCVIQPKKGKEQFTNLKKLYGYDTAWNLLRLMSSDKFKTRYKDSLRLDSEGVPTLESFLKIKGIKKYIGETNILNALNKQYTLIDDTQDNYYMLLNQAAQFNNESDYKDDVLLIVRKINDKIKLEAVKKTSKNVSIFKNQYGVVSLNRKLANILAPLGITVGKLNEIETKNGRVGHIDFSKVKQLANNVVDLIRVANNQEGTIAISEEASHLFIEALNDNPIVQRLLNQIINRNLIKSILGDNYDSYYKYYQGDVNILAKEALGQLLQKSLLQQSIEQDSITSLFDRFINLLKNKFRKIKSILIQDAILEAETLSSELAKKILTGDIKIDKKQVINISYEQDFNALSKTIDSCIDILKQAHKTEARRFVIYGKNKSEDDKDKMLTDIANLEFYQNSEEDTLVGIFNYLKVVLDELKHLNNTAKHMNSYSPKNKFKFLRTAKNYVHSYSETIKMLKDLIYYVEEANDEDFLTRTFDLDGQEITISKILNYISYHVDKLNTIYSNNAKSSFIEFLRPYLGKNLKNPFSNDNQTMSVESLVNTAFKDLSFFDRWLDSMADSADTLLQLFDSVVKKQKDKARESTIKVAKQIEYAFAKAKAEGISDFTFIYKKENGKRTNKYLSRQEAEAILSLAEYEFYNTFITLKGQLDLLLPNNQANTFHVIQIRKDWIGGNLGMLAQGKFMEFGETLKNKVFESVDDNELFGEDIIEDEDGNITVEKRKIKSTLQDFNGREYNSLPIYYIRDFKNQEMVSDDPVSSLIAYAYMAHTYDKIDEVVDILEIGRNLMLDNERKVQETKGGVPLKEVLRFGDKMLESVGIKTAGQSNILSKLNDFFESNIYQKYIKDEGTFKLFGKEFNIAKVVNLVNHYSSVIQLSFNGLAQAANVSNGVAMTNIEAAAQEFFKASDLAKADGIYAKEIVSYLAEITNPVKTSKLALFEQYFNTRANFDDTVRTKKTDYVLSQIFGDTLQFLGQNTGDHWLYNRVAIAYALNNKVINRNTGEQMSLWEALEVIPVDKNNPSYGATLKLKNGFELIKEQSFLEVGRKINKINQKLFGIYNQEDQAACQRTSMGRLLMQYRKWVKPAINRRFTSATYDNTLDRWEEGYYITTFKFLGNLALDLKRGQFQMVSQFKNLNPEQKQNIIRAVTELGLLLALWLLISILNGIDDDDKNVLTKYGEYMAKRLFTEIGAMTPTLALPEEALRMVKSPMAAVQPVENVFNLLKSILSIEGWVDERKSGPYKGWTDVEKYLFYSVPYAKSISRSINVDEALQFYN